MRTAYYVRTVRTAHPPEMRTVARQAGGTPFKPKDIDWDGIERDYRSGIKSNRQIAQDYGCSESAVRKAAKDGGWIKGEATAVRALAYEKANAQVIPGYVPDGPERIEQLAQVGADVLVRHRRDAITLQSLVQDMVVQLHDQTHHEVDLASAIEEFFAVKAAENPLLAKAYKDQCNRALHAISLGSRSKTMVNLANAMEKLVGIERKAWKLDEDAEQRDYESLLAEITSKTKKQ